MIKPFKIDNSTLNLFACDLDNTLIHSYKHRTPEDICIEIYNDREQSFISSRAINLLRKIITKIIFIPVTTRSIEQYNRIKWQEDILPKYAVVSNGANLIEDGKINTEWQKETLTYIQPYEEELHYQHSLLSQDKHFSICRIVDNSFLFLKCCDELNVDACALELQNNTKLTVEHFGRKIYLFPPLLNKGEALRRLQNKISPIHTFCAGDSYIDIPMLNLADTAYVPEDLAFKINNQNYIKFQSTEDILQSIKTSLPIS